jgi:hypothetical protein
MTARTPPFPAASAACRPRARAHSAFTHIFTSAITHFAALCALFLRRRCRRGKLLWINILRRRSQGRPSWPRAKARMQPSFRNSAHDSDRNSDCDQKPNLSLFVSMFAKARWACRKRRPINDFRLEPQWRALCPGHKKTQKPSGGRIRAQGAFAHIFASAITHFAALCALFLRRGRRRGNPG